MVGIIKLEDESGNVFLFKATGSDIEIRDKMLDKAEEIGNIVDSDWIGLDDLEEL